MGDAGARVEQRGGGSGGGQPRNGRACGLAHAHAAISRAARTVREWPRRTAERSVAAAMAAAATPGSRAIGTAPSAAATTAVTAAAVAMI